jgi:DNA-binding MarR family transcriptional regulator
MSSTTQPPGTAPAAASARRAPADAESVVAALAGGDGGEVWLFELAPRLSRLQDIVLKQVTPSLTFRQYRLLRRVVEGNTTLTAIGRWGTLSLPSISESIETLVRKGVLRRETDASDRRSSRLALTPEGVRVLAESQACLEELAETLFADLSPRRRADLRRDIGRVDEKIKKLLRELR